MEESEKEVPWKPFFSHPLFSCLITLYTLLLLYFPHNFLRIFLSPVLLITGVLLVSLVRFGSTRDSNCQPEKSSGNRGNRGNPSLEEAEESGFSIREAQCSSCETEPEMGFDPKQDFVDNFVEWNVRAPLQVIHEAYDEEEDGGTNGDLDDDDDDDDDGSVAGEKDPTRFGGTERFPSLSLCYPESDSDSSSDSDFPGLGGWASPEKVRLRWEEDDGEGLIEISLDDEQHRCHNKTKQIEYDFHAEEESLIEIDLSP